jgi:predicted ABC-type sugar transport system permease subunit
MIGVIVVVAALSYGAHLLGLSSTWIYIVAAAILGLGVMAGVARTRTRDSSQSTN